MATYAQESDDLDRIREEVAEMARHNVASGQKKGLFARTVTIKVRSNDFTTIRASQSQPPRNADEIARCAVRCLDKTEVAKLGPSELLARPSKTL
jgi:nucleotidyltransferase/DNA polymerase involved in DNA repair